jgi:hypothetical protein
MLVGKRVMGVVLFRIQKVRDAGAIDLKNVKLSNSIPHTHAIYANKIVVLAKIMQSHFLINTIE